MLSLCRALARKVGDHGARTLMHVVARRAMSQVRRDPEILTRTLRRAHSLLIVCHGNIIRSAYAAHLLRQKLGATRCLSVSSAGLEAVPGRPAHETALRVANTRGIDLTGHRARRLVSEVVAESDVILVMDVPQLVVLRKRFPEASARTFLLTCLAPETPLEVGDPVQGDEEVFELCFNHISTATGPIVKILKGSIPTR